MIDFILKSFTGITSKCLEKNSKEYKTEKKNMQLVFKLGADGETEYLIYKSYEPQKVVTFLEVLGVRFDIRGYSVFVPKFIKGALERFCEQDKIDKSNVRVVLNFDDKDNLLMWLYDSNKFIKQVELENMFETEDILEK